MIYVEISIYHKADLFLNLFKPVDYYQQTKSITIINLELKIIKKHAKEFFSVKVSKFPQETEQLE